MSTTTIASIPRIPATALSELLLRQSSTAAVLPSSSTAINPVAVVDVRDDDHIGGHIRSSLHRPSIVLNIQATAPGAVSPFRKLVQELRHCETVVFHCALSQQRGPSCAVKYARERRRWEEEEEEEEEEERSKVMEGGTDQGSADAAEEVSGHAVPEQKIYILDRGFVGWQESYGEDTRLTEGYRKELWR